MCMEAKMIIPVDKATHNTLLGLMSGGQRIEAIKFLRQSTGVGLREAKDAVEHLGWLHGAWPRPDSMTATVEVRGFMLKSVSGSMTTVQGTTVEFSFSSSERVTLGEWELNADDLRALLDAMEAFRR